MSDDEKMATIGRLTTERAEAKRQQESAFKKIKGTGDVLYHCAPLLMRIHPSVAEYKEAIPLIDGLQKAGGLDDLKKALTDYLELKVLIENLTHSLHEIGAD